MEVLNKLFEPRRRQGLQCHRAGPVCDRDLRVCALSTAVQLTRYARRSRVPSPLFVVIALVLFMVAVGFTRPFFINSALDLRAMTRTFSQLSNTEEHRTDVFFIMLFALGMTSLVGFSQLCLEAIRRGR
jgi:hypothetical protein